MHYKQMSLVSKEFKAAKANKINFAAAWLDVAKANRYIPRKLIFFAL